MKSISLVVILLLIALIFIFPLVVTLSNSFMSENEIEDNYSTITAVSGTGQSEQKAGQYANIKLIPDIATLDQFYTVLIKRTQFLFMFWNSVKIVFPIILGQIIVGSMAAYAFSRLSFPGRDKLFFVYIIVMMMPFQVTLVPNYIVAEKLGIIGSHLSIILPGVFTTFGVFLLKQFMSYIPEEYMEAAKIDGANHFHMFLYMVIPMTKSGLAALAILVFIDNWNMVEQPIIFLNDDSKMPLSIFLSSINTGEMGIAFASAAIFMAPMLLIFLYSENYLVEGIQLSGIKG
ncbi:MAG: carbohydrate ABC transporter permease [Clostridia bacterium]|nr:carbohydrate ABC transporter permease [Clostridia bacterium]